MLTFAMSKVTKILVWIAIASVIVSLALPVIFAGISPIPLLAGLLLLAIAVAIPILLGRKRGSLSAAWVAVYIVVYGLLSRRGGFIDGNFGGSDNRSIWYPAYCGEAYRSPMGRQKCSLRPLGWFFLPLVLVDRTFVHRTHFDVF